jgi:hypothetical protein
MSTPKMALETNDIQPEPEAQYSHEDVAQLAYSLWERRETPGTPEEDWFEAERQLKGKQVQTVMEKIHDFNSK